MFVDERRGADRVPGPEDSAAAMVMANSIRSWDQNYDLQFKQREAQKAVDSMEVWRQHMLVKGAGWAGGEEQIVAEDADLGEGSRVTSVLHPVPAAVAPQEQEEEDVVVQLD